MKYFSHLFLSLDSYLIRKNVFDDTGYVAGYALIKKKQCEVFNFISPTLRLLRFIDGESDWLVDGNILRIHAGDVVIFSNLCKRNIHRLLNGEITYEMYDFFPSLLHNTDLWKIFYSDIHIMACPAEKGASRIYTILDYLHAEMLREDNTPHRVDYIRDLINLLAIEFSRRQGGETGKVPDSLFRICDSVQYITSHLTEKLDLQFLSKLCGYTPEYYSRLFKKCTGMTPKQFIINARIDNTLHLIQAEHFSVLNAAYTSGFQSSAAFYKSFKLYRGVSPHQFISAHERAEE